MRVICENCGIGIYIEPNGDGEGCWKCGKFVEVKKEPLPDLKDF